MSWNISLAVSRACQKKTRQEETFGLSRQVAPAETVALHFTLRKKGVGLRRAAGSRCGRGGSRIPVWGSRRGRGHTGSGVPDTRTARFEAAVGRAAGSSGGAHSRALARMGDGG